MCVNDNNFEILNVKMSSYKMVVRITGFLHLYYFNDLYHC